MLMIVNQINAVWLKNSEFQILLLLVQVCVRSSQSVLCVGRGVQCDTRIVLFRHVPHSLCVIAHTVSLEYVRMYVPGACVYLKRL